MAMELFNYFVFSLPGAPTMTPRPGALVELFDTCLVSGMGLTVVQQVTIAGGVATIEVAGAPVALDGGLVEIAGASVAALNGVHRVQAVGTNTITIHVSAVDATLNTDAGVTVRIPSFGWEIVHTAEHRRIYKSKSIKSNGLMLYVDDRNPEKAEIYACEEADDIDTRRGEFGGESYKFHVGRSDPRHWMVVGDDRAVYWGLVDYSYYQQYERQYGWQAFAELQHGDTYATLLAISKTNDRHTLGLGTNYVSKMHKSPSGGELLEYLRLAAGVAESGRTGAGNRPFSSYGPLDGLVWMLPISVYSNNMYRGTLPGKRFIPHEISSKTHPLLQDSVVTSPNGQRYLLTEYSPATNWTGYCAWDIDGWRQHDF